MNVTIIGAGAMGCLFAGYLAEGGMNVSLLERCEEIRRRIDAEGVVIDGVRGRHVVHVTTAAASQDLPPAELLLLFVKSYDTAQAVAEHAAALNGRGLVLTMQNGIGNVERIAEKVGVSRVLAGTTTLGANVIAPGVVRHAGEGKTLIGEVGGGRTDRTEKLAQALTQAGIATDTAENIDVLLWDKLCVNAAINPLTALLNVPNGVLAEHEQTRLIMRLAIAEVVAVAAKKNYRLNEEQLVARALEVARQTGENRSSMLADVLAGRRTEIDFINGAVVRHGKEWGVPTPVNELLTNMVKTKERIR